VSKLHVLQRDMTVQTSQNISQFVNKVRNTLCHIKYNSLRHVEGKEPDLFFKELPYWMILKPAKVVSKLHVLQWDMSVQTSQNISQLVNKVRNTLCHIKYNSLRHNEGKEPDLFLKELPYWMILKPAKVVSKLHVLQWDMSVKTSKILVN
jgi:hypothetical protein